VKNNKLKTKREIERTQAKELPVVANDGRVKGGASRLRSIDPKPIEVNPRINPKENAKGYP